MEIRLTIVLLIMSFLFGTQENPTFNMSQIKTGMVVDVTTYSNQKTSFEIIQKEKEPFYTPSNNEWIYKDKPKIIHNNFGTFYLYDLSYDGLFLNVLGYDTLTIEANLSNVTLGIADKRLFLKEDHFSLPLQNKISLQTIFKKVNLSRLKYIVVRTDNNNTFSVDSIRFQKTNYCNNSKTKNFSVWIWQSKNIERLTLERNNIKYIYIQINKEFETSLKDIKESNVTLYGLNGSPDAVFEYQQLLNDIELLGTLQTKYPFIKGYQIDVEPYLLAEFSEHKSEILEKYLTMINDLKNACHQYGLKLSVVIPFWFDKLYLQEQNIGFAVIDSADEVVLMSYRSNINEVISLSSTLLDYANHAKKPLKIGLELMKIEDETHQVYSVAGDVKPCLSSNGFSQSCINLEPIRTYVVSGENISFFGQMQKLNDLNGVKICQPSFDGFVFHHYALLPTDKSLFEF